MSNTHQQHFNLKSFQMIAIIFFLNHTSISKPKTKQLNHLTAQSVTNILTKHIITFLNFSCYTHLFSIRYYEENIFNPD